MWKILFVALLLCFCGRANFLEGLVDALEMELSREEPLQEGQETLSNVNVADEEALSRGRGGPDASTRRRRRTTNPPTKAPLTYSFLGSGMCNGPKGRTSYFYKSWGSYSSMYRHCKEMCSSLSSCAGYTLKNRNWSRVYGRWSYGCFVHGSMDPDSESMDKDGWKYNRYGRNLSCFYQRQSRCGYMRDHNTRYGETTITGIGNLDTHSNNSGNSRINTYECYKKDCTIHAIHKSPCLADVWYGDLVGYDHANGNAKTLDECKALCLANPACNSLVVDQVSANKCYLKTKTLTGTEPCKDGSTWRFISYYKDKQLCP